MHTPMAIFKLGGRVSGHIWDPESRTLANAWVGEGEALKQKINQEPPVLSSSDESLAGGTVASRGVFCGRMVEW